MFYRVLHFGYQTHCFADDTKRRIQGLHDLINFSGAGGSVEYTHNGVSIGWHIAKKPGLKTFVVQRAAHSIKEGGCSWMCAGNALPGAPRLMPVGSHVFANSEYTVFRT